VTGGVAVLLKSVFTLLLKSVVSDDRTDCYLSGLVFKKLRPRAVGRWILSGWTLNPKGCFFLLFAALVCRLHSTDSCFQYLFSDSCMLLSPA